MDVTVIIRTKNEGSIFKKVLLELKKQSFQDFDIVQVDDNSTDGTEKLATSYFPKSRVKVVAIPENKFTHPYSCNLGAEYAKGKLLVYMNGHCIPINRDWLKNGVKHFSDKKIAGVFAYTLANPSANAFERFCYWANAMLLHSRIKRITKTATGLMGTTNAVLRRDLWKKHKFQGRFGLIGGEDTEWASHWIKRGYVILQDPAFRVYHSHDRRPLEFIIYNLKWVLFVRRLKQENYEKEPYEKK